jgi:hypothetical protein
LNAAALQGSTGWRTGLTSDGSLCYPLTVQDTCSRFFRRLYNHQRPQESLRQNTPASVYEPATRPFPDPLPEITYPDHFEVRLVSQDSTIRWKSQKVFVSHLLGRLYVGLEQINDELWSVFFGPVHLGWLDEPTIALWTSPAASADPDL